MKDTQKKEALNKKFLNTYVRDYYNKRIGALAGTYADQRWHSSLAGEFDYKQTSRALDKALSSERYKNAVEIGPGDGVWTKKLSENVEGNIHLIEQSSEMLSQARKNIGDIRGVTFENADFMESDPQNGIDLIMAIRCFEYFSDKDAAIKKMFSMLRPGGRMILVTKNAKFITSVSVQRNTIHSDQLNKKDMKKLLVQNGFVLEGVYSATHRWKVKYRVMRHMFDILHRIIVWSKGYVHIPLLYTYATESFVYVASRPRI